MAKEKGKQPAKENTEVATPIEGSDLDQLRGILFGNQSRAIEERLDQLEMQLESLRQSGRDELRKESSGLKQADEQIRSSLSQMIEEDAQALADTRKELKAFQRSVAEDLVKMKRELKQEIATQTELLQDNLESARKDLIERLIVKQSESRQRDDALRNELLALSAWLDNSKTSRMQLGEMLLQVGQQLQENGDSGSRPEIAALNTNVESG